MPRNRVIAMIGPSGCGKSTFLRSINRLNDLIPGCRVDGELLHRRPKHLRAQGRSGSPSGSRWGWSFRNPIRFPSRSTTTSPTDRDSRAFAAAANWTQSSRIAFAKAALWEEVKDRLSTSALGMSGGQQQRLCIARALATRPTVLLMDEPCSALDPIATTKIEDLITELRTNYTIVIVTHNMQQAARVSDLTAFFYMGLARRV